MALYVICGAVGLLIGCLSGYFVGRRRLRSQAASPALEGVELIETLGVD